ncbi:tetratricopeptide repeat protein [Variovorax soli]|uniref:TPR repeat protein n=1 Tax=Variovorax soli TaxID=376815 RepID=A0ABU1NC38_9BURK|nr:tetratricopeptide repeat protein [Variovorax soli]MDR6536028.1 TPR repeat protein [Variovorax soli]
MHTDQAERVQAAFAAYKGGRVNLAYDLYRQLADEGNAESQIFTAWMLSQGVGCTRDEAQAAIYYERAAALGHPAGCFYFGRWLTKSGEHAQAYACYAKGAQAKHLPSMFRVGYSLARGKGVNVDLRDAYTMLKAAASRGHAYALREMALQDLRGGRGLLWIPIGLLEFLLALCWGIAVSMFNKDTDLLRG